MEPGYQATKSYPETHGDFFNPCQTSTRDTLVSEGQIKKLKLLDLFSGTGSISKVYKEHGYETVTVDFKKKWNPDIEVDVLNWDYKSKFTPGEWDTVTCGIPCTEFSIAITVRPRNLPPRDLLPEKGMEISLYLKPLNWYMEQIWHRASQNQVVFGGYSLLWCWLLPIHRLQVPKANSDMGRSMY